MCISMEHHLLMNILDLLLFQKWLPGNNTQDALHQVDLPLSLCTALNNHIWSICHFP